MGQVTGNSRAGIERTGAWVEEIWRKLQLKEIIGISTVETGIIQERRKKK